MQYRDYGKTGLRVSALGHGAMRLPKKEDGTCDFSLSVPMLRKGIDLGINYIDSAWGYINGTSEVAVGQAIKPYDRSKLVISTKIPIRDIKGKSGGSVWRSSYSALTRPISTSCTCTTCKWPLSRPTAWARTAA